MKLHQTYFSVLIILIFVPHLPKKHIGLDSLKTYFFSKMISRNCYLHAFATFKYKQLSFRKKRVPFIKIHFTEQKLEIKLE